MFLLAAAVASYVTLDEYAELCPPVDFSPRHPVCYEYEPVYVCETPEVDFSPSQRVCTLVALCPTDIDFGPTPEICEDKQ